MPTYEQLPRFRRDLKQLSREERRLFRTAVRQFVAGLPRGPYPARLRLKGVQTAPGVYELTWAPDGRATFEYGDEVLPGQVHIIWRRVGTHAILDEP
jgi:hypothetical protein